MPQVDQRQSARLLAETLDTQHQLSAGLAFDAGNAPHQIPAIAPSLQAHATVACLEQEIIGGNGERFFAGLAQNRLGTVFDKALDGVADVGQWVRSLNGRGQADAVKKQALNKACANLLSYSGVVPWRSKKI
jgi:hypothetical protein